MDNTKRLAPHESFELHELLTVKNICATKSLAMANLVKDDELKMLMRNDFAASQQHIRELRDLLRISEYADTGDTRDADTGTARDITH